MKPKSLLNLTLLTLMAAFFAGCGAETADSAVIDAIQTGDYVTAGEVADSVIAATGGDKLTYRAKGIALLGQGEYSKAKDAFVTALSCSNGIVVQDDIDISYYLAVAEYKNGDLEEAHSTVDAVAGMRPKDDAAYYLRGKIELAQGDKEAALTDFDKTVSLAPTNYDRFVGIYEELHSNGYDTEAASYLEKAISAGNKLSDYNKGVLEYYLGSYTEARNDLENAKKSGNNENLTLYLGKTYEALGDDGYAMSLYEEYIRENPSAGRIYEQLATCRLNKGEYDSALDVIEAGLSLGDGEGLQGMMYDRVVAYEWLYDFDNAKKSMDEYLAIFPDDEAAIRENVFLSSR